MKESNARFSPMPYFTHVGKAITYYESAFQAKELRRWSNEDGSVHVAEMSIGDAIFHLHENTERERRLGPDTLGGTTVVIGLFVSDPDTVVDNAVRAGGELVHAVQDYDYGYRQGTLRDPFGHYWQIQKRI